jgi:hypothetical protein
MNCESSLWKHIKLHQNVSMQTNITAMQKPLDKDAFLQQSVKWSLQISNQINITKTLNS